MGKLLNYLGSSKVIKRISDVLNVTDVQDGEGNSLVDENGIAIVTGGGGGASALNDLSDVNITSAADYQTLIYDSTDQEWQNGSLAFTNLSDVNISSPSNNQVLKYNNTAGEWQNTDASWLPTTGGKLSGGLSIGRAVSQAGNSVTLTVGGNSTPSLMVGVQGIIKLVNSSDGEISIVAGSGSTTNKQITVPLKTGTMALTSDLPTDFVPASTGGTFEGDISIVKSNSSTSTTYSNLTLGNDIPNGTEGATHGVITLYGRTNKKVDISADLSANDRVLYIPNASGYFVTASAHYGKSVSNTANETWKDFLNRLRTAYLGDGMVRRNVLRFSTLDGQSNFILHCDRFRNQDTSVWSGFRIGPNGIVFYSLSFGGSSTVVLRKGACNTSNVTTVEDITEDSQGNPTKVSTSADAVTITVL